MAETVSAALMRFRLEQGLDPHEEDRPVWLAQLGHLIVPLPNFRWRRNAISYHDAHHLVTDYPVTPSGEMCVAAWELGAKCYVDWQARMLCGFLMALGLMYQPKEVLRAYKMGRYSSERYRFARQNGFLDMDMDAARHLLKL